MGAFNGGAIDGEDVGESTSRTAITSQDRDPAQVPVVWMQRHLDKGANHSHGHRLAGVD